MLAGTQIARPKIIAVFVVVRLIMENGRVAVIKFITFWAKAVSFAQ